MQLIILHQDRAARAGGHRILVVGQRSAGGGGENVFGFVGHVDLPVGLGIEPIV